MMDKRGEGLSDGHGRLATFEDAIDDVRCVLDAVGSDRAVVLVSTDACPLGILFAATHPDRVAGLVCREGWARPFAVADESIEAEGPRTEFMRELLDLVRREWGTGGFLSITVDGAPDEADVAVGRGALGTKRRDATAGRGTILDDRAHRRAFGVAARVVSDAHGAQPRRLRLPARVGSIRRRARRARHLRRAALRQDLLVERRGRARGARPRRTLRSRRARCRRRTAPSGC